MNQISVDEDYISALKLRVDSILTSRYLTNTCKIEAVRVFTTRPFYVEIICTHM